MVNWPCDAHEDLAVGDGRGGELHAGADGIAARRPSGCCRSGSRGSRHHRHEERPRSYRVRALQTIPPDAPLAEMLGVGPG